MERATAVAIETADLVDDPTAVNVLAVHGTDGSDATRLDPEQPIYRGPAAGAVGRLHAATEAVGAADHACLHHPAPDHSAGGPWLVVEPLGGRLSTVHRGRGTVTLTCTPAEGGVDAHLRETSDRLEAVIEAARPHHEYYPVHRDDLGTFTTGMTTFSLRRVEVTDDRSKVTFGVATTPVTNRSRVEARFEALDSVESVTYEADRPVAEADPGEQLRAAVESAATTVLGDWTYEWGSAPTAFSEIPSIRKIAMGTGMPGAVDCDLETIEDCRRLLSATFDAREEDR